MRTSRTIGVGVAAVLAATLVGLASWDNLGATAPAGDPAVRHDARIVRDTFGVPHIFGRTDADVAYGLAYAEAEDDFGTIEEVFAATRGRAGAITGQDGAKLDFANALLDARAAANRGYSRLAADTRALVEGYAAGLNRYAAQHPGEVRLRGLFPVTGRDVVAGFALRSPFFFGLDKPLGALVEGRLPPRDAGPADERGSNAFAVTAARSDDATTRLISNSHQPWSGGVSWYEAVVHSEQGWDFAGALFPGAPYPLLGHNKTLGWTNTVNRPDLIDTYRLVLDADGTHYRFDGQWLPLQRTRVWLHVKFGPFTLPVPRTLYRSVHGPVIENKLGAFALRYTTFGDVRQIEQYYRLNKARDFGEWRDIMRTQGIPGTNFVYADAAGHIGMFYNARFPARAPGFDWKGVLPGDTSKALWTAYLPFDADPQVVDPKSGWVANSNNTPFIATGAGDNLDPKSFAPEMGIESFVTNRARRFEELFAAAPARISRTDLLRIKFDKAYSRNAWAGPWIAKNLAVPDSAGPDVAAAKALLRAWDWTLDGQGAADAIAALVIGSGARAGYANEPTPDAAATLPKDAAYLRANFGRLDPPLGTLLRDRRGKTDVPVYGGPDALRAIYWHREDGVGVGYNGDSFIMLIEWGRDGQVHSRSIQPWGAAATRPESKHYADQAPLFARQQWKPVWFDPGALAGHVEREYHP